MGKDQNAKGGLVYAHPPLALSGAGFSQSFRPTACGGMGAARARRWRSGALPIGRRASHLASPGKVGTGREKRAVGGPP